MNRWMLRLLPAVVGVTLYVSGCCCCPTGVPTDTASTVGVHNPIKEAPAPTWKR